MRHRAERDGLAGRGRITRYTEARAQMRIDAFHARRRVHRVAVGGAIEKRVAAEIADHGGPIGRVLLREFVRRRR